MEGLPIRHQLPSQLQRERWERSLGWHPDGAWAWWGESAWWQWHNSASVDGVDGHVDLNVLPPAPDFAETHWARRAEAG